GEAPDRFGVVRGVLNCLGQQGQGSDRRLELVTRIGHEVPADFLDTPPLGLVLDKQQDQPATADAGSERSHPDSKASRVAFERSGRDVYLTLADLTVSAHLTSQREQLSDDELVALHQPERARGLASLEYYVVAVDDHG